MADTQKLARAASQHLGPDAGTPRTAETADRDFTAEERQTYDRMEADLDSLGDRIERSERAETRNEAFNRVDRRGVIASDDEPGGNEAAGTTASSTRSCATASTPWMARTERSCAASSPRCRTLQASAPAAAAGTRPPSVTSSWRP